MFKSHEPNECHFDHSVVQYTQKQDHIPGKSRDISPKVKYFNN